MTAITEERTPIGGIVIIILLMAAVIMGASFLIFTEHSQTSHASQVPAINQCFGGGGTVSGWYVGPDGRWGRHCTTDDGNRFWRISECVGAERVVITQFKQKLSALVNYVRNREMVPVAAPPPCR